MRGLLAVECLYHQIIAGNKTQTRRSGGLEVVNDCSDEWGIASVGFRPYPHNQISSVLFIRKGIKRGEMTDVDSVILKPRYKIGEVMYLKEPVSVNLSPEKNFYYYDLAPNHDYRDRKHFKWPNKLFMPASAARAFIRITGIRCERLMDISDEDCIAEGIEDYKHMIETQNPTMDGYKNYRNNNFMFPKSDQGAAKLSFLSLYKFANKVKEVPNLWVFCYNFEYLPNYKA